MEGVVLLLVFLGFVDRMGHLSPVALMSRSPQAIPRCRQLGRLSVTQAHATIHLPTHSYASRGFKGPFMSTSFDVMSIETEGGKHRRLRSGRGSSTYTALKREVVPHFLFS